MEKNVQVEFKAAGSFSGFVPARSVTTWVFSASEPTAQPMKDEQIHVTPSIVV